jgi:hypothetical protein
MCPAGRKFLSSSFPRKSRVHEKFRCGNCTKVLDKKIDSNGWVGTVGDLWKWEDAKIKDKKQDKLILILRFYLKTKKT